jgi:PKD repeat protein
MKNLIISLSLAVFCLLSATAFSQTTFTGAISDDWADTGNWDNELPAAGNDATIPIGMTVLDSSFCGLDTAFVTIQIVPPPFAALTISQDTICEGENVIFTNLSGGGANSYMWNFGDGTGWQNLGAGGVNHTYNFTGDYVIQLAAFIAGGTAACTDTVTIPLHVLPSPVANFNFNNNSGCDSLTVTFTDFSSVDVVIWSWDFDNGNFSNLQIPPSQFYGAPGNYNVQLDVTSANGCTNTSIQVIDVFQSPVPAFTPTSVCQNEVALFTDLSTSSAGDPIITWGWDFGDGNSSIQQNPTHTYTTSGPVNVILDVSTAFCSASDTVAVTVEVAPTAAFTPDALIGCSPLGINFTNNSSTSAVNFLWDFGDGNTSTATNPTYTYINNFGFDTTFTVTLISQTTFGCADTTTQTITVYPNPIAGFTHNATLNCAPLIVDFTNSSTGAVSYSWDFGDGTPIDNSVSPSHIYNNLTQFIDNNFVTLIATSLNGCTDTLVDSVLVFPEPQFGFSTNPDSGCMDSNACNYDSTASCSDGSCLTLDACGNCGGNATAGCMDSSACNYDSSASCSDGSCLTLDACGNCGGNSTAGCMDSSACNYDATASCSDGSCLTLDACGNCGGNATAGCMDSNACNYDVANLCDDGSCTYPGCTNISACNYDSMAGCDDGGCEYTSCTGCTYATATNYDSAATIDDGTCVFPDITSDNQAVYDGAYDDGVVEGLNSVCPGDFSGDGHVNVSDLGGFLGAFGTQCE